MRTLSDRFDIAYAAISHGALQKPQELAEFLGLLVDLKSDVIVEIGVFSGGTLYAWSHFARTVIGIDKAPGGPESIYLSNGQPRDEHGAIPIIGDSHDPATLAALTECLAGQQIDCLFIDGDHTYEGVRQDYEMYSHLVRPGGLVAFHDIVTHAEHVDCHVDQLWAEIKDDTAVEIIDPNGGQWAGIGVLCIPA